MTALTVLVIDRRLGTLRELDAWGVARNESAAEARPSGLVVENGRPVGIRRETNAGIGRYVAPFGSPSPHLLAATFSQTTPTDRVTLLGTGSPTPSIERFGPSILVEAGHQRLLLDAGRGATIRLTQLGVPLGSVTAVVLTHLRRGFTHRERTGTV